jgi:predicted nucleotidyltransferase
MSATSKSIESLVQNIVEAVHPLKIILLGSYARDTANPESDIDVLVVMPEGVHCRRTAQLLYR